MVKNNLVLDRGVRCCLAVSRNRWAHISFVMLKGLDWHSLVSLHQCICISERCAACPEERLWENWLGVRNKSVTGEGGRLKELVRVTQKAC